MLPKSERTQSTEHRRPGHILWTVLIARICEVFPLLCPFCGGQMRVIAFFTYSAEIWHILWILDMTTQAFSAALTCSIRS